VDADTKVKRNFISEAAGAMRDGADAVQAAYLVRNSDQSGKSRLRDLGLRAFNITRLTGRERLGISVGLLGNGFGLRSETLRDVPYLAASVVEDLEYHLMLVANGRKVRFIGQTAVFGEVPLRTEGVRSQRARWEGGRLRIMVRSTPRLLAMILQGKPRLLEPLFELLLLPLAFHAVLLFIALSSPSHLARVIGLSGLFVVWFHLLVTIILGGWNWSEVLALARAPIYIAWKVLLLPSLIQNARSRSLWVRTKRNSER
jgi:cellulose synthase/poly-beta-1,6-N-acetylglucosamine synthase-like glycosyltransferase